MDAATQNGDERESAMPIIRAAAVDAVRCRIANDVLASRPRPPTPPKRRDGSAEDRREEADEPRLTPAVPEISASAPTASASSDVPEPSRSPVTA